MRVELQAKSAVVSCSVTEVLWNNIDMKERNLAHEKRDSHSCSFVLLTRSPVTGKFKTTIDY